MASRQGFLAAVGLIDVTMNIAAFEVMNKCKITVEFSVLDVHGKGELMITAQAWKRPQDGMEAPLLASVSVSLSGTRLATLESALIHALYQLDGKLANNEMSPGG